jgi:hypothetical protein
MITQLHDMGSARQSAKMAVKNHQKPISLVVFKMMATTFAIPKTESHSGFSCQMIHCDHLEYENMFFGTISAVDRQPAASRRSVT